MERVNQNNCVYFNVYDDLCQVETNFDLVEEIWELDYGALKVPFLWC